MLMAAAQSEKSRDEMSESTTHNRGLNMKKKTGARAASFHDHESTAGNGSISKTKEYLKIERLTSNEEMSAFLEKVDQESEHITVEVFGESAKGRSLYLVKFGNDIKNPTILFLTQKHGNEPLLTESAIQVIRKLAANNKKTRAWADQINILFVPRLNPDGAEGDVDFNTSRLYRGGVQTRNNANNVNLNKTHSSLSQPETKALHENVLKKYNIDYAIDFHHQIANRATSDGKFASAAMLYPTNDGVKKDVLERSKELGAVVYERVEPKRYSNIARYHSRNTSVSMARNHFAVHYDIATLLFETRGLSDSINKYSILEQKDCAHLTNQGEAAIMAAIEAVADGSIETADTSIWDKLPEQHTI